MQILLAVARANGAAGDALLRERLSHSALTLRAIRFNACACSLEPKARGRR